jgi:exodeoxyribonuclease-3
MKLATFNINGIRHLRLPRLLEWLERGRGHHACRNSRPSTGFPIAEINAAAMARCGTDEIWNVAIWPRTANRSKTAADFRATGRRQSRYIEAAVDGIVVCCLYLPNGNPQPAQVRLQTGLSNG